MKKTNILSLAVGSALIASSFTSALAADANPFSAKSLAQGYQVAENDKKAEGKCGGHTEDKHASKQGEAKCGADKKADNSDHDKHDKKAEGKCGEGKCGAKH